MGPVISESGVEVNPENVRAVERIIEPSSMKDVWAFLVLLGYIENGDNSIQQQHLSDSKKQFAKLKELRICQMVKTEYFYKLGLKFCANPPHFLEGKIEEPEVMIHG